MNAKNTHPGTVAVGIVLLLVVAAIILGIASHFWCDSANRHFDGLIAIYIEEKPDYGPQDHDNLRQKLLETGIFIKIHRWSRDSFIKDPALYRDMIAARDRRQMRKEEADGSVIDAVINL